ncbi:Sugar or nucleoside kinase, ribokinase family [Saccharopolyspora kobensis]|uniref:Ribokinase/argininosuccinate lyase n=1 Tax=Saccharopolyspora kobensis TaxID=146035 RepID=A0A1H6D1M1_9PSEU|nr:carbohydrate kinase family protein [Saccharopolyspora kobensis]SEG79170.1 Sugar or nucleoside kinase, ribokinase family [Saccharopolyspora kobensis]SFD07398.1 ribokinase/argininosuccinate lyase [Saccharopolyspora kobensis]
MNQPAPDGRITVVGNVNLDVLVAGAAELPPPGTEQIVPSIVLRPGGSAANTAVVLAQLGRSTVLAGRVGDDGTARLLAEQLDIPGLRLDLVRADAPTGVTVAAEAPGRDRSFLSALGAMAEFDAEAVPAESLSAKFVLLSGYFLLPALRGDSARDLLAKARRAGARTALDTGWDPAGWSATTRAEVLELLREVDVFLPNEDELRALHGVDCADEEAARGIADETGAIVVVKRGALGALVAQPGQEPITCPAPEVRVRDSTGAGDAFNAGLLHRLADGVQLADATDYAVRVAATVIVRPSHDRAITPEDVMT